MAKLAPHHALPDGYGEVLRNMAWRAENLARFAMGLTERERRILVDMTAQLRKMAGFPL